MPHCTCLDCLFSTVLKTALQNILLLLMTSSLHVALIFFAKKKHPRFKSAHHELSKQESPADAKVSERDLQQSLLYL